MRLYDPLRPTLGGQQLFLNGHTAIKDLAMWPMEDGTIELFAWLPIKSTPSRPQSSFSFKEFTTIRPREAIMALFNKFLEDPETLFEELFDDKASGFRPDVRSGLSSYGSLEDKTKYPKAHGAQSHTTARSQVGAILDLRDNSEPQASNLGVLDLGDDSEGDAVP